MFLAKHYSAIFLYLFKDIRSVIPTISFKQILNVLPIFGMAPTRHLISVQEFESACSRVQAEGESVKKNASMKELLELYALFKQAKFGDCNTGLTTLVFIILGVVHILLLRNQQRGEGVSK